MMDPPPLAGVAGILLGLGALLIGVSAFQRRARLGPESARKCVHIVAGTAVAAFPWIFYERWPVWALAILLFGFLAWVRRARPLREGVGSVFHGVGRPSWGELFFPFAAALVWSLAPGDWVRFSLPILVLAVADALAALVGKRWGINAYRTGNGMKSWEGSAAFAAAAFLVVATPLGLTGRADWTGAVLIGLGMAFLLMLVESMAWEGLDNLLVPIAGTLFINQAMDSSATALFWRVMVLLGLAAFFWWWRNRTTLDDGAVLAAAVMTYALWTLGGVLWIVAPLTVFAVYARLYPPRDGTRSHTAIIPLALGLPALIWVAVNTYTPDPLWPFAAAASWATHLAAIGLFYKSHRDPEKAGGTLVAKSWLLAQGIVLAPAVAMAAPQVLSAAAAAFGGLAATGLLWASAKDRRGMPVDPGRWARQAIAAFAGSALVVLGPK